VLSMTTSVQAFSNNHARIASKSRTFVPNRRTSSAGFRWTGPIGSKRKVVSDLVDLRWDGAVYKLDVPGEAEAGSAGTQPS
jgi:hypothetical protein